MVKEKIPVLYAQLLLIEKLQEPTTITGKS